MIRLLREVKSWTVDLDPCHCVLILIVSHDIDCPLLWRILCPADI